MIYDSFLFFNEFDILDIRLHTLNHLVDKFILIESSVTHAKKNKPLFFEANKDRFAKFLHKIEHIIVPTLECTKININGNLRHNIENYQRDYVNRWLRKFAKTGDIIIVSDLDEIPNPETIKQFIDRTSPMVKFRTALYRYYLNLQFQYWEQGFIARHDSSNIDISWSAYRQKQALWHTIPLLKPFEGWHFSYVGGIERLLEKVAAYRDNRKFIKLIRDKGEGFLAKMIAEKKYVHFKKGSMDGAVKPIKTMPAYVQKNQEKFKHLLLEEGTNG